jgi:N-acetylglutamate synthase-like GNAT family acetyltransferase
MQWIVREAAEADLQQLVSLLAQLDPENPGREDAGPPLPGEYAAALDHLAKSGHHVLIVEDDDRIVGTLTLHVVPNLSHRGTPYAVIENVVVDDAVRSRGHGKRLIEHAVGLARGAGCYKVVQQQQSPS